MNSTIQNGSITVSRDSKFTGGANPVNIYVDGEYSQRINNGKSVTLSLSPGVHKVYIAGASWNTTSRSNVITLDVQPGKNEYFKCGYGGLFSGVFFEKS